MVERDVVLYTMLYMLFTICILYPPMEFVAAGFTIQSIFSFLIGTDEQYNFIKYHRRRITLTIFIHCSLPLLYFAFLSFIFTDWSVFTIYPATLVQLLANCSILITISSCLYFLAQYLFSLENDSTVRVLKQFNVSDWKSVAKDINDEFRRFGNYTISLTGIDKVIMTNSWILSVSSYAVRCAQVSDVVLEAIKSDEHPISNHESSSGSAQYLNIRVSSATNRILPFFIRIRAESFRDMQEKLSRPIIIAKAVVLKQSLSDRFVQAFSQQVMMNQPFIYDSPEHLDLCFGCAAEEANVKLVKNCSNTSGNDHMNDRAGDDNDDLRDQQPECSNCYCRPMWCDSCMARIFGEKQDKNHPERWLPGKAQCPTCRAVFCVLDVSPIQIAANNE